MLRQGLNYFSVSANGLDGRRIANHFKRSVDVEPWERVETYDSVFADLDRNVHERDKPRLFNVGMDRRSLGRHIETQPER